MEISTIFKNCIQASLLQAPFKSQPASVLFIKSELKRHSAYDFVHYIKFPLPSPTLFYCRDL